MQVWQHLSEMDHLRRRAEDMIVNANGTQSVSAASYGHHPYTDEAHRHELSNDLQSSPLLADLSQ